MTLSCDATGNPVPSISWTRNGSPIDRNVNSRISFSADKKQFTITNVSRTDSGKYRCVARNSLGNATSNDSYVDIQCKRNVLLSQENVYWYAQRGQGQDSSLKTNKTYERFLILLSRTSCSTLYINQSIIIYQVFFPFLGGEIEQAASERACLQN